MNPPKYALRWVAAGAAVLALASAGTVAATTEPPEDTTAGSDTSTADSAMTEDSAAAEGAGPSNCPAITAGAAGTEAEGTDAAATEAAGTMAEGTDAAGTEAAGTEAAGTMAEGAEAAGTEAAGTEAAGTEAAGTEAAGTEAEGSAAPMTGPFVQIVETDEYGPILVDGACFTLYMFMPDGDAGGEPTCVADCAAAWPPLLTTDESVPPLGDELDPSLFSVVEHESGPMLKVGDWPLYYFAEDTAAGDINGQGVGGVWWVVAPDGTPISEEDEAEGTAAESEAPAGTEPAGSEAPAVTEVASETTSG